MNQDDWDLCGIWCRPDECISASIGGKPCEKPATPVGTELHLGLYNQGERVS